MSWLHGRHPLQPVYPVTAEDILTVEELVIVEDPVTVE